MKVHQMVTTLLLAACASAHLAVAGPLSRIYICPGNIMLNERAQQQFQVFGFDSDGNTIPVSGPVAWTVDSRAGAITQGGLLTSSTAPGLYREAVRASLSNGMSALAEVWIVTPGVPSAFVPYLVDKCWGQRGPGELDQPISVTTDSAGNVYVTDGLNKRVQKFDASGNYLSQWGSYGSAAGQFNYPAGIAIDSTGCIYVSDAGNYRIQKFDSSGKYLRQWGGYGSGNGQFTGPRSLAIDRADNLYVLDQFCVQKYTTSGVFLTKWGSRGTGAGQFDWPTHVAADASGNVYVVDNSLSRVEKFSSTGQYLAVWGGFGNLDGQFSYPVGIAVDRDGNVLVADTGNGKIKKFSSSGVFLSAWSAHEEGQGRFQWPTALAGAADGSTYVLDQMDGRLQKYDSAGSLIYAVSQHGNGRFGESPYFCVDSYSNIYILDPIQCCVQKFDSASTFVTRWGSLGSGDGQFSDPRGIAVGPDGCLYVADTGNMRIQKFTSTGGFLGKWPSVTPEGRNIAPTYVDTDAAGNVYTADVISGILMKYSSSGEPLSWRSPTSSGDSGFQRYEWFTVDAAGNAYTTASQQGVVRKIDTSGKVVLKFGSFSQPTGIDVGPDGSIYVVDWVARTVQKFDQFGRLVTTIGGYGNAPGQFLGPMDVVVDQHGVVYVAEAYQANRIQTFTPTRNSVGSVKSLRDGSFIALLGQGVAAGTSELGDCAYIESSDRSSGIKITGRSATRGMGATVTGILATVDGEREIQAIRVAQTGLSYVFPFSLTNKALGGGDSADFNLSSGAGQRGVEDGVGLNNVGLLVTTTGKVKAVGDDFFYVDDGTHARDASIFVGVRVKCGSLVKPEAGKQVSVTGISVISKIGGRYFRCIRPRTAGDIAVIQ